MKGGKWNFFFPTDIDLNTHAWLFLLLGSLHRVWLFATLWTAARYSTLSIEFSRQEYWSRLPFPLPGGLPDPGIKSASLAFPEDSLTLNHQGSPMTILKSEVAQSCLTLCDPMDCSLPRSSAHGLFQARILEWVASSFSRSSRPRDWTRVSRTVGRHFTVWATREG